MGGSVLMIGAAHLDIIASYDDNVNHNRINKVGNLKFAMGGAAYNVAANLSIHQVECGLLTATKQDSYTAQWLTRKLEKLHIHCDVLLETEHISEDGYVALMTNGSVITGVTSSNIEYVDLTAQIETGVKRYDVIVVDCNLSISQIRSVVEYAGRYQKPVFVQATSEMKLFKALYEEKEKTIRYKLFSMNAREATVSFRGWEEITEKEEIVAFCKACYSEYVVVTNGKYGYSVFDGQGERRDFKATKILGVVSTLGAGDALLSAVVEHYIRHEGNFCWEECEGDIKEYVNKVLMLEEASLGEWEGDRGDIVER